MRRLSSEETALLASMPPLPIATAVVASAAGRPRWATGHAQAEWPQTAHRSQTDGHDGQPPRIATTDGHDRRQATSTSVVAAGPHQCEASAIAARLQSRRELAARLPPPPPLRRRLIVNKSSASDAPAAAAQEESYLLVSSLGRTLVKPPRLTPGPSDSLSPSAQPAASAMRRLSSEETALLAASAGVPTPVGDISLVFPLPPTPTAPAILRHGVTSPCDGLTTAASNERADRAEYTAASHDPAAAALPVPLPPPNLQPHPARRPSLLSRLMRPLSLARPPAPGLTSPSLVARRRRTSRRLSLEPSSPVRSPARPETVSRSRAFALNFHHSATVDFTAV